MEEEKLITEVEIFLDENQGQKTEEPKCMVRLVTVNLPDDGTPIWDGSYPYISVLK